MCGALAASSAITTLIVGPGVPLAPTIPYFAMNADAGDLNGDSLPDVVVGFNFGWPVIYLNNGSPTPFTGVEGQEVAPGDTQGEGAIG
jgi:hypothetical protein